MSRGTDAAHDGTVKSTGLFCRNCYAALTPLIDDNHCWNCGLPFNPARPSTYLIRPFPGGRKMAVQIVVTTLLGFAAAAVVAFFQTVRVCHH